MLNGRHVKKAGSILYKHLCSFWDNRSLARLQRTPEAGDILYPVQREATKQVAIDIIYPESTCATKLL